jgi:hypothetical protein
MLLGVVALLACASESRAQNFNGGNNTAFDPQISVVNSGTVLDVQATVSADRKYVTMTMRPQLAQLIALRDFAFQNGNGGGVVGMNGGQVNGNNGVNPSNVGAAIAGPSSNTSSGSPNKTNKVLMPAFAKPAPATPVLFQEGMQRVDKPTK